MSQDEAKQNKIDELLAESNSHAAGGRSADAFEALRSVLTLDPTNNRAKQAFEALETNGTSKETPKPLGFQVIQICKKYIENGDETFGKEALHAAGQNTPELFADLVQVVLTSSRDNRPLLDQIMMKLLRQDAGSSSVTKVLQTRPEETFEGVWSCGDESTRSLAIFLVRPDPWHDEAARGQVETKVLKLLLAKLHDPGLTRPESAMKTIAVLFSVDAPKLHEAVTSDNFELILSYLNITHSVSLRSQTTLVVAKFLEVSPQRGESILQSFVMSRASSGEHDAMILAFSVAGAIFPVVPTMAAALFLVEGFLESLTKLMEKTQSTLLKRAALELLSAACIDRACRDAITKHCRPCLNTIVRSSDSAENKDDLALAALVLAKTTGDSQANGKPKSSTAQVDLVSMFKTLSVATTSDGNARQSSVEGLAYKSIQPVVKEEITNDAMFLKKLIQVLDTPEAEGPMLFGGLTIIANITTHTPKLSEEQKRMAQLKAYANQSQPTEMAPSPLDSNAHVVARCKKVIEAGVLPLLNETAKRASPILLNVISTILFSLTRQPHDIGIMAQQGLVGILVYTLARTASEPDTTPAYRLAALSISRVLIRLNPALLFRSEADVSTMHIAIAALTNLIDQNAPTNPIATSGTSDPDYAGTWDALRALTNLATLPLAANHIVGTCWEQCETQLHADHSQLRVAAAELMCNLSNASDGAVEKFISEKDKSGQRLRLMLQLFKAEKMPGQLAAGAVLAAVVGCPDGAARVIEVVGSVEDIVKAFAEGERDLSDRSIVVLLGLLSPTPRSTKLEREVKARACKVNAVEVLKGLGKHSFSDESYLEMVKECLKKLAS